MKLITKLTSPLLVLNLLIPPSIYADGINGTSVEYRKTETKALQAMNDMQRAGAEFYLDAAKTKHIDLRDLRLNSKGIAKVYAVTPFDRELNASVGVAETIQMTKDGKVKLTVEILKNESKGLVSFPIRAIKSVNFISQDTAETQIKFTRTVQAALGIAKNQIALGQKSKSAFERIASSISETLFPSANAKGWGIAGGIITGIGSVAMIMIGMYMIKEGEGGGGYINIGSLFQFCGVLIVIGGIGLGYTSYTLFRK